MAPLRREPLESGAERHAPEAAALHGKRPAPLSAGGAFAGVERGSRGRRPLVPKGAHVSRGTPLWLGWRAVSLPQALGGQSRLTNQWLGPGRSTLLRSGAETASRV